VVAGLARALSYPSPRVRDLAAIAPQALGGKAIASIPGLIYARNDPVICVRASVAKLFDAMGPATRSAVGPLTEKLLLTDEDGSVRLNATYALRDIGPAAKEAIPAHQQALETRRVDAAARAAILKIEGKPVPTYH
jgi:HEAT repeat protein